MLLGSDNHHLLCSKSFAETLQRVGVRAESILYEGKTHTDLFLQVRVHINVSFLVFVFWSVCCFCGLEK